METVTTTKLGVGYQYGQPLFFAAGASYTLLDQYPNEMGHTVYKVQDNQGEVAYIDSVYFS